MVDIQNKTVQSVSPMLWPPEGKAVHEVLLSRAAQYSEKDKPYLIDGSTEEKRYYENFEDETRRIASCFYKKGLRKGDIVVYLSQKQINLVVMQCGVWRANGIIRSVYPDEDEATFLRVITESKAKWVLCDSKMAPVILSVTSKVPWSVEIIICEKDTLVENCTSFEEFLNDDGSKLPQVEVSEDDTALILPTSGTTGSSKGAVHSHRSTLAKIKTYGGCGFSRNWLNMVTTRSTHVSGTVSPLTVIEGGYTGVVLPVVTPETLIRAIDKYKPGSSFALPSYTLSLGSHLADGFDLSSLKIIFTGGTCVTPEMLKVYKSIGSVTDVIIAYGLTEGAVVCSTRNFDEGFQSLEKPIEYSDTPDFSVGKVCPGSQVQIRDIHDSSKILQVGERGEICFKGELCFKEYYLNPEKTKDAFVDGWFKTGDVGYYDEKGFVYVVDRCKDIFKYDSNHISPTEIENVISQHPSVREVCVVPVKHQFGEVPKAFVSLKVPDPNIDATTLAEEIKSFANNKLASYKQLRGGLEILDDLPRGKTGKVTRSLLMNK